MHLPSSLRRPAAPTGGLARPLLAAVLLASVALGGCNQEDNGSIRLRYVVSQVEKFDDPFKAYTEMVQAGEIIREEEAPPFLRGNALPQKWDWYQDRARQYLIAALDRDLQARNGKAPALRYLFAHPDDSDTAAIRASYAPKVLARAAESDGQPGAADLLAFAGQLLMEGRVVIADYDLAYAYLARAWAAGSTQALSALRQLSLKRKDFANAYLWQLRCIGGCQWQGTGQADAEPHVPPAWLSPIQAAARDRSVIKYQPTNTTPGV